MMKWVAKTSSWLHLFHVIAMENLDSKGTLTQFMMCLWNLWKAYNSFIFAGKVESEKEVVDKALSYLQKFQKN